MPMEFLTDAQGAGYGRFDGMPSRAELERFFFLDDADKDLLGDRRGDHNRLGLMLQATTVRYVGRFLEDPRHGSHWNQGDRQFVLYAAAGAVVRPRSWNMVCMSTRSSI